MARVTVWKAMDGLTLRLVAGNTGLRAIMFGEPESGVSADGDADAVLREAIDQLSAYFAGSLREFSLPLETTIRSNSEYLHKFCLEHELRVCAKVVTPFRIVTQPPERGFHDDNMASIAQ